MISSPLGYPSLAMRYPALSGNELKSPQIICGKLSPPAWLTNSLTALAIYRKKDKQ